MMTDALITGTVDACKFEQHPNLRVKLVLQVDDPYLQIVDDAMDPAFNSGRKWRLSRHMCRSEIVATVFAAYSAWVEHEARESFTYRGESIYGPHYDVDTLWVIAQKRDSHEYRQAG